MPHIFLQYNLSPPQPCGDALKSYSLDRKQVEPIVLTKWRHSAYLQESNDKVWAHLTKHITARIRLCSVVLLYM